ncbi:hypothetical protein E1B28_010360 [Marasmius oreades]|nr:uncharacterized protein E1B28_010360 [Marasmius oreades]KAG7091316.1 hypothetical protein E1B28_010360 [Marasmius oreades]
MFARKDYASASVKYTEAIALDEKNPILYANRSACRLHLKQFLDAATDALMATKLNPYYGKAWARLATAKDALGQPEASTLAWQEAIDTLPKENLTESERKQKSEYETGLAAASKALEALNLGADQSGRFLFKNDERSLLPWMCALAMIPQLERERKFESSAWTISQAYLSLEQGNEWMNEMKTQARGGDESTRVRLKVIEFFSNAIMLDSRAFHVGDPDWGKKFNLQMRIENSHHKSWAPFGPEKLFREVEDRLAREGWESVRPALSTTVRSWIMFGFLEGITRRNYTSEAEHMIRAIDVIKWGRETWKNVPSEDRGVIFLDSFLRGVQKLHIEALVKVCATEKDIPIKLQRLEDLLKAAEEMIKGIDGSQAPARQDGPSSAAAFYYYPRGYALGAKAFYYGRKAELTDTEQARKLHAQAFFNYVRATKDIPEDDEQHALYLKAAIEHMIKAGAPVGVQLKCMEKLRLSIERMGQIWGKMLSAQQREYDFVGVLGWEEKYKRLLAEGEITEDSCMVFDKTINNGPASTT